jgi:phage gpG-like protein
VAGIFSFEVTGDDKVRAGMAVLMDSLKDLRPFWRDVWAPKYFAMVQDLFATGGRARGGGGRFKSGAWAPLSPRYRIWKQKHYPGQPILVREGRLRTSVTWTGQGLGAGGIFQAHPTFVVAGTSIPYGQYHQEGTATMPARSFLPPPDPAVFAPLLQQWLMKPKGTK